MTCMLLSSIPPYAPQSGYDVQGAVLGSPVGDGDPDEDVVGGGLGVLGSHVPVPALVKHACRQTSELHITGATSFAAVCVKCSKGMRQSVDGAKLGWTMSI